MLIAGGGGSSGALSSDELYNPATGTWSSTASLSTARYAHTATLLPSGKVLLAGGVGGSSYLSSAELYNPANGFWSNTATLPVARLNSHRDAVAVWQGAGRGRLQRRCRQPRESTIRQPGYGPAGAV